MGRDVIQDLIRKLRAKHGSGAAMTLASDGARSEVTDVVPFGLPPVDRYVLGCGGLPVGRITELFSEEGAGKSSLGFAAIASAQREGGIVVFAETENALQPERAAVFGVDRERLVLLQPSCLEELLEQATTALEALPVTKAPSLFLWDSVAATPTKQEMEDGLIGKDAIGVRARILSRACRSLCGLAAKKHVAVLIINQTRQKIGVMFGDPTTTPGGEAVKFHASIRLRLYSGHHVKTKKEVVGKEVRVKCVKNKLSPPFRSVLTRYHFTYGWDAEWTTLTFAKDCGLVPETAKGEKALAEATRLLEACGWSPDSDIVRPVKLEAVDAAADDVEPDGEGG